MEVGGAIGITIATPGLIKTDLTLKADFKVHIHFLYIFQWF